MEKGTREVRCPHCPPEEPTILRIRITVAIYGKAVQITCPKCKQVCKTTIPVPALETPEQILAGLPSGEDVFGDLFGDMFKKK